MQKVFLETVFILITSVKQAITITIIDKCYTQQSLLTFTSLQVDAIYTITYILVSFLLQCKYDHKDCFWQGNTSINSILDIQHPCKINELSKVCYYFRENSAFWPVVSIVGWKNGKKRTVAIINCPIAYFNWIIVICGVYRCNNYYLTKHKTWPHCSREFVKRNVSTKGTGFLDKRIKYVKKTLCWAHALNYSSIVIVM